MSFEENLRGAIEEIYERIRSALGRRDFEAFRSAVEPAPAPPADWEAAAQDLEEAFPPLAQTRFLCIRKAGDWAGYYFEAAPDDPDYGTLELLRFRRADGGWKLSGDPVICQFAVPGDPAARRNALLDETAEAPFLKLPGEPGFEEE